MNCTMETFVNAEEHRSHRDVRELAMYRKSLYASMNCRDMVTVLP